ncbi:hypothetical protein CQ14_03000 [Bradyrhizobium lablabi]|uniref:Uncharacterized protein n=1 Tax=Bradyrhizobium lablabi TaxID=722472 RepID=A0A0R3N940_9BRAD|nr:hypothetical protein [Bradyrhizobium lablabi]KRR26469.1 hypothetical protein CQ14_03000 [Bradyrhizobium lablabi]
MIKLLCAVFFACVSTAAAQDIQKIKDAANNFSHENLICGAYYLFVAQCIQNKNPNDPLAAQYTTGAQTFMKRGIETGKLADVSDKAISAKVEIAVEEMKTDTENNCVNISVLYKKHAHQCKSTYENGPAAFSDRLTKMGVK